VSRPASEPDRQYRLLIDWDAFAEVELVEEVLLPIIREPRPNDTNSGVEIEIRRLREKLGRMEVKRLARSLILLADPFAEDPSSFVPEMISAEFDDLARLVSNRYFLDADFHLVAAVNESGIASARVVDWPGEELFAADHHDLTAGRDQRPYRTRQQALTSGPTCLTVTTSRRGRRPSARSESGSRPSAECTYTSMVCASPLTATRVTTGST
jgi:hypothetical protein